MMVRISGDARSLLQASELSSARSGKGRASPRVGHTLSDFLSQQSKRGRRKWVWKRVAEDGHGVSTLKSAMAVE